MTQKEKTLHDNHLTLRRRKEKEQPNTDRVIIRLKIIPERLLYFHTYIEATSPEDMVGFDSHICRYRSHIPRGYGGY